jgi:hypothetical protein
LYFPSKEMIERLGYILQTHTHTHTHTYISLRH